MKRLLGILMIVAAMIVGIAAPIAAATGFIGPYEMQNWSSSGIPEGTTSITPSSGPTTSAQFAYNVSGLPWVPYRTATFSTVAPVTGLVSFDWTYTFDHAWYWVYADLYVFANGPSGTTSIHPVEFFNWGYTGPRTFSGSSTIWIEKGYEFGFEIGGSNFDSAGYLNGTLTISNFVTPNATVGIDIKPGSDPNSVNPAEQGLLPVAILGSESIDVHDIKPETIAIGSAKLAERGSAKSSKLAYSFEDINLDGYSDMVCFFKVQALALTGTEEELRLTAVLDNGITVEGIDSIRIVPPK